MPARKLVAVFFKTLSFRSLGDDVLGGMVRALGEAGRSRGLTLYFYDRNDSLGAFADTGDWRDYAGVLGCIPASDARSVAAWKRLERRLPCVAFLSAPLEPSANGHYVGIDDRGAMELLVDHVVGEGARSIGWCSFGAERYTRMRFAGFQAARSRHGRMLPQAWVHGFSLNTGEPALPRSRQVSAKSTDASRMAAYRRLLQQKERPDAILCDGDQIAVELAGEARRLGLRIPEDLMVSGFDDTRAYLGSRPEITTIHQDFRRIARGALLLLLDLMERPRPGPEEQLLAPRLVVRASTARRADRLRERSEGEWRREWAMRLNRHLGEPGPGGILAAALGLSTPYFLRRWRALMGKSFVKDLHERRLEKAAKALRLTKKSITHIYLECGFSNHVHFNKLFKRAHGQTAREYRKTYRMG